MENNKKELEALKIQIIYLESDDIIITSRSHTGRRMIENKLESDEELYDEE